MENKEKIPVKSEKRIEVNWEKVGVYVALTFGLFTIISYLFQLKDENATLRERIAKVEVKVDLKKE